MLNEDLIKYIEAILYCSLSKNNKLPMILAFEFLNALNQFENDEELLALEFSLSKFCQNINVQLSNVVNEELVTKLINDIVEFAGMENIRAMLPKYRDKPYTDFIVKQFGKLLLNEIINYSTIDEALDACFGKDTIPVMTVHKSKGLEYHTTVFAGLKDGAFWNYSKQADEDKCTFFVALSRAKKRVVFTFCDVRKDKWKKHKSQSSNVIREIMDGLEFSGIAVTQNFVAES